MAEDPRRPGVRAQVLGAQELLALFPPQTREDGDGMLVVGGCRLDELAQEYGAPVMIVAEDALRQRARDYRRELADRWPHSRVAFASKAFPCTALQRVMVSEGLWLDVAGGGEILSALAAGADPVFAADGAHRLVVRRETWAELLARDVAPGGN